MKKANIIAAISGMILSGYAFIVTFTFKQFKNVPVGPDFFPRYLSVGLFICCLVLLIQNIKSKSTEPSPTLSPKDAGIRRMLIAVAAVCIYVALWNIIGFILATLLILFAIQFLLGMRTYFTMSVVSVCASLAIFFLFKLLLGIEMPLGFMEAWF